MKKIALAAFAALATFALASCNAEDISAKVTQAQAIVAKTCGFVPAAAAVASIMTSGNPAVSTVTGVATAICNAYTNKPKTLFGWGESDKKPEDCVVVVEDVCVPGEKVEGDKGASIDLPIPDVSWTGNGMSTPGDYITTEDDVTVTIEGWGGGPDVK